MAVILIAAFFYNMTIRGLYNKIQTVDTNKVVQETMEQTTDEILTYNLNQLIDGKTSTGEDITPSYLDDPYFKTREAAQRYSDWKDRISPASKRKKGTPNLFINGYYHSTRRVSIVDGKVVWTSSYKGAGDIERKFKNIDGLNKDSRSEFIPLILRPVFRQKMEAAIGLKMK